MYPYQDDATCASGTITATIPTTQTATAGTFDPKANISVTTTEAHPWDVPKFGLKNVVGLLKFTVDATYAKAIIAGTSDEDIAGKITVSAETGENPPVVSGSKTITLTGGIKSGGNH